MVVFEGLFDRLSDRGFEGFLATEAVEDNVGLACFWEEFCECLTVIGEFDGGMVDDPSRPTGGLPIEELFGEF